MATFNQPDPNSPEELRRIERESQMPRVITEARVKTPMLVVLLGSTPARAALEMMSLMLTLSREDQRRAAFMYLDTDDEPQELRTFRAANQGKFIETVQRIAVPAHPESASWPADPRISAHTHSLPKMPQFFASGAGGIRNNGHVALAFDHSKVRSALENALRSLEQISDTPGAAAVREVQVNVVAFLGGGTGSGILADILVMIRNMLIQHTLFHRLNAFCILPENIRGAAPEEVSWRQSNAVAALLEVVAHSLAADVSPHRLYNKYLLETIYQTTSDALANEIYLIAQTGLKDAVDVARLVGLELFQRLGDASGVGYLEHSKWVDRRTLGQRDGRNLPTPFGMSCTLEAVFPAQATARAFAQISASHLLPSLIGAPPPPPEMSALESQWEREFNAIADFNAAPGAKYAIRHSPSIPESEFLYATDADFDRTWQTSQERTAATQQAILTAVQEMQQDELAKVLGHPPDVPEDRGLTPMNRQIQAWRRLQSKYRYWKKRLEQMPPPPVVERPDDLEARYNLPIGRIPAPEAIQRLFRPGKARELADTYYRLMADTDEANRHVALSKATDFLLVDVSKRLAGTEQSYKVENLDEQAQQLYRAGTQSAAWRGKLDQHHPHQRHIYDLAQLRDPDRERNLAVERLYLWATLPGVNLDDTLRQGRRFGELVAAQHRNACLEYMRDEAGTDDDTHDIAALEAYGRDVIAQRVVAYFEAYYLKRVRRISSANVRGTEGFNHFNLFQLLELGTGDTGQRAMAEFMRGHLEEMRQLIRSLVNFTPALEGNQSQGIDSSLYLGIRWDNDTQRQAIESTLSSMGPLTGDLTPMVANLIDPHRLQIVYGRHGISLSTIPDFHQATNSMMGHYLRHQAAWFGSSDVRRLAAPSEQRYGRNGAPVHNSREMEWRVCGQNALGLAVTGSSQDSSLRGQIIRDPFEESAVPEFFDEGPHGAPGASRPDPQSFTGNYGRLGGTPRGAPGTGQPWNAPGSQAAYPPNPPGNPPGGSPYSGQWQSGPFPPPPATPFDGR